MSKESSALVIVEDYIEILRPLCDYETTLFIYPAMVYPMSLLPHPKQEIVLALSEIKEVAFIQKDYELVQLIDWSRYLLDAFINDREAYKQNWQQLADSI